MLDQNFIIFAQAIHEQRIKDALREQHYWQRPTTRFSLPQHWANQLGDRLIALGSKLKAQDAASLSADPFAS